MSITRKTLVALAAVAAIGALSAACTDEPTAPTPDPSADRQAAAAPAPLSRTALGDGIAHYTYDLTLGPGPFDRVRLHRIVEERRPNDPIRTVDGVFLLPGAPNGWVQIFVEPLISDVPPRDQSVAIFLAQNGVDVWGIDYAWAQVPRETTDFGFMQDWGVGRDVDHALEALAAARSIRTSTGQGNGRLHLLGFSYGGPVGYGVLGRETQLPPGRRTVKGFVAVDSEVAFEDPERRATACADAKRREEWIASGTYVDDFAVGLIDLAGLAEAAPDEPSPVVPALTNWEFILNATASGRPHFVGAEFDAEGVPTGLRFTEPALWIDVLQATRPYLPLQVTVDMSWGRCRTGRDVAFDDHLGDVTVPILYVGAAGGGGRRGAYTVSLTSTRDYEEHVVQRLPDADRAYDFGHADLFTAREADTFVWEPILAWLVEHRENRTHPAGPGR